MGLITNILGNGNGNGNAYGAGNNNGAATAAEHTEGAGAQGGQPTDTAAANETESSQAVTAPNGANADNTATATQSQVTQNSAPDATEEGSATSAKLELREGEVEALDYIRRAAIAAQAKLQAANLLTAMAEEEEAFAPLAAKTTEGDSAYAKANQTVDRHLERVQIDT